jgi:hypothetical protein
MSKCDAVSAAVVGVGVSGRRANSGEVNIGVDGVGERGDGNSWKSDVVGLAGVCERDPYSWKEAGVDVLLRAGGIATPKSIDAEVAGGKTCSCVGTSIGHTTGRGVGGVGGANGVCMIVGVGVGGADGCRSVACS